jgi:Secretion system C-terminal sorting domain
MKRYSLCSAYLLIAMLLCDLAVASAQDIPTISLSIPQTGQSGAPANGAQVLSQIPPALLLRERAVTLIGGSYLLPSGSLRISRSTNGSLAPITLNYSLDYYNASSATVAGSNLYNFNFARLAPLPNMGSNVIGLPVPTSAPPPFATPVFTPALPGALSAPTLTAINGLQGDLAPNTTTPGQGSTALAVTAQASLTWANGVSEQLISFRGRFSDQQWYPRNPGRQGARIAIMRLLPSPTYHIQAGADSALIILDDPAQVPPVLTNGIRSQVLAATTASASIEVSSPEFRPDAIPYVVFYDDNYDILTYTPVSSDTTLLRVGMSPSRYSGIPERSVLTYTVATNATFPAGARTAIITLRANDGISIVQPQTTFAVLVMPRSFVSVSHSTTLKENIAVSVYPNPVTDKCLVSTTIPDAGFFTLRVTDVLGTIVYNASVQGARGSEQQHTIDMAGFAAGTYFVEVNDGARTSSRKIVKM